MFGKGYLPNFKTRLKVAAAESGCAAESQADVRDCSGWQVLRLTMVCDEFQENSAVYRASRKAWPMILCSVKTLLETGEPLPEFMPESK
jgi:hypothetical protein